jgi:hypothetical protein
LKLGHEALKGALLPKTCRVNEEPKTQIDNGEKKNYAQNILKQLCVRPRLGDSAIANNNHLNAETGGKYKVKSKEKRELYRENDSKKGKAKVDTQVLGNTNQNKSCKPHQLPEENEYHGSRAHGSMTSCS